MNALQEFVEHVEGRKVLCAEIFYGPEYSSSRKKFCLKIVHNETDMDCFLESLDFEYDSGYGVQEVFGYIWYTDGTWSERSEYDGSEWWSYQKIPNIPDYLTH